jgi:hypothetical protein
MTPSPAHGDRLAATRSSYDAVAAAYADAFSDELRRKPLDRALLTEVATERAYFLARARPEGTPENPQDTR